MQPMQYTRAVGTKEQATAARAIGHFHERIRSPPNIVLARTPCTPLCTVGFYNPGYYRDLMKADLRIFVKDYRWNKILKFRASDPLLQR